MKQKFKETPIFDQMARDYPETIQILNRTEKDEEKDESNGNS